MSRNCNIDMIPAPSLQRKGDRSLLEFDPNTREWRPFGSPTDDTEANLPRSKSTLDEALKRARTAATASGNRLTRGPVGHGFHDSDAGRILHGLRKGPMPISAGNLFLGTSNAEFRTLKGFSCGPKPIGAVASGPADWPARGPAASRFLQYRGTFDSVSVGAFDFAIPKLFSPPTDADSKSQFIEYIWSPYYSAMKSSRWPVQYIGFLVDSFSADRSPGLFWKGVAPGRIALQHAIALVYTYSDMIFDGFDKCKQIREGILSTFDQYPNGFVFNVDDYEGASQMEVEPAIGLPEVWRATVAGIGGKTTSTVDGDVAQYITFSRDYVETAGEIADRFLYYAERLYWYARSIALSDGELAFYYMWQAVQLGRLALSAVARLSSTALHEMIHFVLDESAYEDIHCELHCCQAAVSYFWLFRVMSYLGLYRVNYQQGAHLSIDLELTYESIRVGSICRDETDDSLLAYAGFTAYGSQGNEWGWYPYKTWQWPDGC